MSTVESRLAWEAKAGPAWKNPLWCGMRRYYLHLNTTAKANDDWEPWSKTLHAKLEPAYTRAVSYCKRARTRELKHRRVDAVLAALQLGGHDALLAMLCEVEKVRVRRVLHVKAGAP